MEKENQAITLDVNGVLRDVRSDPDTPLLFVLRNEFGLKAAKLGCGLEQCGACAVLVNGQHVLSCSSPVGNFQGQKVVTPECQNHGELAAVRAAFQRAGAAQCGYCIPGMVVAATALLIANRHPSEEQIRQGLSKHLCRCGTQQRVLQAVRDLAHG